MAAKKRSNPERNKVEFLADPEWIERVARHAERLGLSLSGYIRLAVNERMERTAPSAEEPDPRKGGKK